MPLSPAFETWVTRLRLAWMGEVARRIWGTFAHVMGDRIAVRAERAQLEHLPEYAEDPASIALRGSETQIDQGIDELLEAYATRITHAVDYWRLASTPLGMLLQLYHAGYRDAVIIQQNGRWYHLPDELAEDPTQTVLVHGRGPALIAPLTSHVRPEASPIPDGTGWYVFDGDIEHCSRFVVLLPSQPSTWRHQGVATFDGSSLQATVTWSQPFPSGAYDTIVGLPASESFASYQVVPGSKTATGAIVAASDLVVAKVPVLAWAAGEHPLCSPSDATLASLRRTINLWRPAKALCVGIYALVRGRFFDYPTVTFADMEALDPVESEVVAFPAT